MKQYIDKSSLVAEIERRIENNTEWKDACKTLAVIAANQAIEEDKKILSIIDALEVKEVDLDDKDKWKNTGGFGSTWDPDSPDYCPD